MCISDWSSDVCSSDLRAAIDGDDQPRPGLADPDQRRARGAIAFHQPVGDIGADRHVERAQQPHEQRRGGRAVDVVIAEDRHRLAGLDRSEEHTSELQSLMRISYAVFCLKKTKTKENKKTREQ